MRKTRGLWMKSASVLVLCASGLMVSPAVARATGEQQDPDSSPATTAQPDSQSVGSQQTQERPEIVVTGSRIGGGVVGSNVLSVGTEELDAIPVTNLSEALKRTPQFASFGIDPSVATTSGGNTNLVRGSALNLRGLGPNATLVMLDGQRLSSSGPTGFYVDPNVVPTIALSRIDVLADGASALYGSDAIAGVVNLILRNDMDGVDARARIGLADSTHSEQYSLLAGKQWGTGGITVSLEHSFQSRLDGYERSFVRDNNTDRGGRDLRSAQCSPGNIVVDGVTYAIPEGGVTPTTADLLVPNTLNLCEESPRSTIIPRERRTSASASIVQEITPTLELWAKGVFTHRSFEAETVRQSTQSIARDLIVPSTNPFFVAPPGTSPSRETVQFSFDKLFGRQMQQDGSETYFQILGGAKLELGAWTANLRGSYGRDKSSLVTQALETGALTAALNSSDPATAFNPFGGPNNPDVVESIRAAVYNPYGHNTIVTGAFDVSGPVFSLPGGEVKVAAGAEYDRYTLFSGFFTGPAANPRSLIVTNSRNQKAAFAEIQVPIFGPGNAMPGFERLVISGAIRYDDYSDVGDTTNYRAAIDWMPVQGLTLRGNYTTSFRAPNLQDLIFFKPGASIAVVTLPDPLSPTGLSTGLAVNAGNPSLVPEEAEAYSFGLSFRPDALPGAYLDLTYFHIDYSQQIFSLAGGLLQSALIDPQFASLVTRDPSQADIQAFLDLGLRTRGPLPSNPPFLVDVRPFNLSSTVTSGIDFSFGYKGDTDFGSFRVGAVGVYTDKFNVATSPDVPTLKTVNTISRPLRFQARGNVGVTAGGLSADVFVNFRNSYKNTAVEPAQDVSSWTTFDLSAYYDFGDVDSVGQVRAGLEVINFFDTDPPFVDIQGGWDPNAASALGRLVALSVDLRF